MNHERHMYKKVAGKIIIATTMIKDVILKVMVRMKMMCDDAK